MLPSSDCSISAEGWDGALSISKSAFKGSFLDFRYSVISGINSREKKILNIPEVIHVLFWLVQFGGKARGDNPLKALGFFCFANHC